MPRYARLPAFLALLVFLVPGVLFAEEKTFADKNCKLTASDSWQWMELSSDMESNGYIAQLARRAAGSAAMVDVRVVPTNGLTLSEQTQEIKDGLSASLQAVQGTKVMKGKLSGLECDLLLIKGVNRRDSNVLWKIYNLEAGGKFHQLMFRLLDGAETKQAKEVDALRRGYRLLKGAGPEEDESSDLSDEEDTGDMDGGSEADGNAPSREGRTISFPSHNVKWTMPADSIFEWATITSNETAKEGRLCRAEAQIVHEPEEGARNQDPKIQRATVLFSVQVQSEGWTPKGVVNSPQNQSNIEESFFDKVDYGRMKVIDELPVGNFTGSALQMVGTKEDKARFVRLYAVALKGEGYIIRVILEGDGNVNNEFKTPVKELLEGIEFIDTFVWVRGPVAIPEIPSHDQARGRYVDEEKEFTLMGFKAKKPAGMAHLSTSSRGSGGSLRLAWEKRSDDKTAYLYFDVQSWPTKQTRTVKDFEQVRVKEREGQWMEVIGSPKTIKRGKTPWFKKGYAGGKGVGYEFVGYLGDSPFQEIGYVVEYKKYMYWIRYQLGGENAAKIFSKDLKTLKKAIKFGA